MNTKFTTLPSRPKQDGLRYYMFNQNNSGGRFDVNNEVAHNVIIQAMSAEEANRIAEDNGIYFAGGGGRDCECCGDRWYPCRDDNDATDTPMIYGKDPIEHNETFCAVGETYCIVYHYNGTIDRYAKGENK
jgi:hypothetical protein